MIQLPPDNEPIDMETWNRLLQEYSDKRNDTPDPEMGDLSPNQVSRLVYGDWCKDDHPLQIINGLPLAAYEQSPFFRHTRKVLCLLRDQDGVKATQTGNFSRKFVVEMATALYDEPDDLNILEYYKAPNEENVWRLHLAKIIAKRIGLIRKQKGKLCVPKSQQAKLAEDRAGELFAELIACYFQEYNLAYSNGYFARLPDLQNDMAYTLYRLGFVASDWVVPDMSYANQLLLPVVQEELNTYMKENATRFANLPIQYLLVSPFVDWGLLEQAAEKPKKFGDVRPVRISSLYREVLRFEL